MALTATADITHGLTTNTPINWQADVTAIIGGVGLLFAKDHDVTGGTQIQPTPAKVLVAQSIESQDAGVR